MEQTADLQAQIDRLSLALHQWRESQDHLLPTEQRLATLTERCAEILNRWSEHDRRHSQALSEVEERLNDWGAIEQRLHQDALLRLRELEAQIEHEWKTLKDIHEAPVQQLREQAQQLGETCMAAANLALRGFERAETRFAALESDLQVRLSQLSHDVQAVLTETRQLKDATGAASANVDPFNLDDVVRIHGSLAGDARPADDLTHARAVGAARSAPSRDAAPMLMLAEEAALSDRMTTLEREVSTGRRAALENETREHRLHREWLIGFGIVIAAAAAIGYYGYSQQTAMNQRLDVAALRVAAAEQQVAAANDSATREIAATRADAERKIAEASQSALQAQVLGNVLAAPDLVRFALRGAEPAAAAYAQVLWSRSRGLVVSASALPAPATGNAYQVWLLNAGAPVLAGTLAPDKDGRATLTTEVPGAPRPVTGVVVTLEPFGGGPTPVGVTVLARITPQ